MDQPLFGGEFVGLDGAALDDTWQRAATGLGVTRSGMAGTIGCPPVAATVRQALGDLAVDWRRSLRGAGLKG